MNLLVINEKLDIDDTTLAPFHGWVAEFAKHCERVTVISLGVGRYELPGNVKVFSLGKEKLGNWKLGNGLYILQGFIDISGARKRITMPYSF